MDKIRVVLLSAFILVSFILASEFAKFKDAHDREQVAEKYSTVSQQENTAADIPVAELPKADPNDVLEEKSSAEKNITKTVIVTTDTLKVTIDLFGGDITGIGLPKYLARIDTPDIPFQLLENTSYRTYIAQSGIIGKNATDISSDDRPTFSVAQDNYLLGENEKTLSVDLLFKQNDVLITKRFSFTRGSYLVNIEYIINNQGSSTWQGAMYGQIKRDGSKDPSTEHGGMAGASPYLGFATTTKEERFKKIKFEDIDEKMPFINSEKGGWIAMIQHYFLSAWIPDTNGQNEYTTIKSKSGYYLARFKSNPIDVAPGSNVTIKSSFYAGPKNQYVLENISESLDLSVDYGVLWMIAQPLYALLYFFNKGELHVSLFGHKSTFDLFSGIGNWGFSIILLTLFVKACFFSLNAKAYNSMAKMRAMQPKMLEIRERFAEDRQQQSKAMMELYSKEKVNPVGGCLPILIQMPVFLSLYWVLQESVELRHAPFIGYIHDLSSMDPYFIMPVIMGISMYIQQKLNPAPPDPMQAKVMQFLPIVFTFFFAFFPSGLVLYWIVNNVLSILQQWVITRQIENNTAKK